MKKCPRCGKLLEDSEFYVQKSGRHKGKLTSWCKKCCSKHGAERYKNNIEKCREEHRNWANKNKDKVAFTKAKSAYGITKEEYDSLIRKCQICGSEKNLVIDHSHQSGKIRGMLCQNCNNRMLVKHEAGTLDFEPTCPIELLEHQANVMGEYLHILEVRAEIENVKL